MAHTPLFRFFATLLTAARHANALGHSNGQLADHLGERAGRRLYRRQVLRYGAGAAALMVLPACKTRGGAQSVVKASSGNHGSVAIIGAGIAGLTAAYRLQQAGISSTIYEARDRVGGRIITKNNFNGEGMFCELGAELVDSAHETLRGLAAELNVEIQ